MTQPDKDAYIKLIRRLDKAAQERVGPFKRPNPNKELLEDAYDAICTYVATIGALEKELEKEYSYKGYPISDLATLAELCKQRSIDASDLRRFISTAEFAMKIGYDYGILQFKERVKTIEQQVCSITPNITSIIKPMIKEVTN